jgi:hypothetical protein
MPAVERVRPFPDGSPGISMLPTGYRRYLLGIAACLWMV